MPPTPCHCLLLTPQVRTRTTGRPTTLRRQAASQVAPLQGPRWVAGKGTRLCEEKAVRPSHCVARGYQRGWGSQACIEIHEVKARTTNKVAMVAFMGRQRLCVGYYHAFNP